MRGLLGLLLALLLAPTALAATAKTTLPDVEDEVMCVTCGTALNVSQAPSADRERAFIRRRIADGRTKAQIKRELVAQYGPKVLAEPHQETSWLIPIILGVLAVVAVGFTARRWRRSAAFGDPDAPDLDTRDQSRLDRDMRAYDL